MATIPNLSAFVEGRRNGEDYDESDNDELVANFAKYRSFWQPYVSVDHEANPLWKSLSFGDVSNARKGRVRIGRSGKWELTNDRGPGTKSALILDCSDVPDEVAELVNSGRLPRVSVEFFDHTSPFIGPDDRPVMTNVLKSVSLLGAQSEASKGMPRPKAVFSDRIGKRITLPASAKGRAKRFWSEPVREQLMQALVDAGADVSQITDDVPDAVLQMLVDAMAAKGMEPEVEDESEVPVGPNLMGDKPMPQMGDGYEMKPKMMSDITKLVKETVAKALKAQPANKHATAAKIKAFRDEMTGVTSPSKAFMTPIQFKGVEKLLALTCDVTVKKFADGKAEGTALDEAIADLRAAYSTPVKKFGDQMPTGSAGQDALSGIRPDVVKAALNATVEGRAALKAQQK